MIVDHLKNIEMYSKFYPNMAKAIEYIKHHDLLSIPLGRHEIDGSNVFLIRDSYEPESIESCFFEGHQKYLDIQIVSKGVEYFGYHHLGNPGFSVTSPYVIEKDIEKYDIKDFTKIILSENMFVIVTPDDLHMPKLMYKHEITVEKAVFKVKL